MDSVRTDQPHIWSLLPNRYSNRVESSTESSTYMAFIDLSKALNGVDRPLLWEILRRSGCLPKFVRLVQLLHKCMQARVNVCSLQSECFDVTRGVKQCVILVLVLFNIYVRYVTTLLSERIRDKCSVHFIYRTDRSLLDLQKTEIQVQNHRNLVFWNHDTLITVRLCFILGKLSSKALMHLQKSTPDSALRLS